MSLADLKLEWMPLSRRLSLTCLQREESERSETTCGKSPCSKHSASWLEGTFFQK